MELMIVRNKKILCKATGKDAVHLVYQPKYKKGDTIVLKNPLEGFFRIRLEDTLEPAIVLIKKGISKYEIPFGVMRAGYSPRAFIGEKHLIEVTRCGEEAYDLRNIAFNPFDSKGDDPCSNGIYPHAYSNVRYADSFRNKIFPDKGLFAPRNVIDGITVSESHRLYPHHSWGVNRNPEAELTLEFGAPVNLQEVILTLRSEPGHDTWWESGVLSLHDAGSNRWEDQALTFEGTGEAQHFPMERKGIDQIRFKDLKTSKEGFTALSGLAVMGSYGGRENG